MLKNIYEFIQKISDIENDILVKYFNNNKNKEYNFYLKNYNETKYIFNTPFLDIKKNNEEPAHSSFTKFFWLYRRRF